MLNYVLQWELTFIVVLHLGKEGMRREEKKYASLYFGGCGFFPLSYMLTGKILQDSLILP